MDLDKHATKVKYCDWMKRSQWIVKSDKFCIWGCMQVREDEQLLLFALKHAEQFEPLGRWVELQLETNPALASLKEVAAEYSASPPSNFAVIILTILMPQAP